MCLFSSAMDLLGTPDTLIIAQSSNPAAVFLLSQAVFSSPFPLNPPAKHHPHISLFIHSPPQIQDLAQGIPGFSIFLGFYGIRHGKHYLPQQSNESLRLHCPILHLLPKSLILYWACSFFFFHMYLS